MVFWTAAGAIRSCDMICVTICNPNSAMVFSVLGLKINPMCKLKQQYGILSHGVNH